MELVVLRLLGAQRVGVGALSLEEEGAVRHLGSDLGEPIVGLLLVLPRIGLD